MKLAKIEKQKKSDLANRVEELEAKREEIKLEIALIVASKNLVPNGCWIVRYRAKGTGGFYWYYKWQSSEPIFVTKTGKNSCHQYIGKAGSPAFLKAIEMMKNRKKIEALQQVLHTLELGLEDLVEEANRIHKNQKSENR